MPLNGYAALFGQGFEQIRNGLRILAASENAGSGDWNDIKGPLAIFTSGTPTSAAVEVMGTGRMRRETSLIGLDLVRPFVTRDKSTT